MSNQLQPEPKKIVIVGGVAGGMSAAARLRRLSEASEITIFERSGYVSFANCGLPYYLGREITEHDDLVLQTPESLAERFRLDVRVHHSVIAVNPANKTVRVKNLNNGQEFNDAYDELILSVGASPLRPNIPGLDLPGLFTLRTLEDVASIETWITEHQPKRVVVAGGGFIGLEVAEQFQHRGFSVTLVDANPQVLKPLDPEMAVYVQDELIANGVDLRLNAPLREVLPPAAFSVAQVATPQAGWVQAGNAEPIPADLVLVGLGVRPEITLAKEAGLSLGKRNGIQVNDALRTSDPHIWAVGDAIEVLHPISGESTLIALGGPANRQGRIVANNIFGADDHYEGTLGTAILRVFELTAASTGLNEGQLQAMALPYEAIYLHPNHHAGYYPGAEKIALKLLFHPQSGAIYGAQAVGRAGVDKRMDVLATAIKAKMTVRDLAELELSYAPPFGSAKDPINLAGMMAENVLDGLMAQVQWHELPQLDQTRTLILDVRDEDERAKGSIPGSVHIPLGQLRDRLPELPKEKTIVAYCQSGQRSYFATRLLNQAGYQAKNLSGAYLTYTHTPLNRPLY